MIAKYPNWSFWANVGVPKNNKMISFKYWGHNHETRPQIEPLKPKWLTFGDHGLRNMR